MSKILKILSVMLILFFIILNLTIIYASDINMNLTDEDNVVANANDDEGILDLSNITAQGNNIEESPIDLDSLTPATGINSIEEEGLSFSNILSILLITIGAILILLAIAIIIRLKQ